MGILKITEYIPRRICQDKYHKELRKLGFDVDGYEYSLEPIITGCSLELPKLVIEKNFRGIEYDTFMFRIGKHTQVWLNYADALANEIILAKELGYL